MTRRDAMQAEMLEVDLARLHVVVTGLLPHEAVRADRAGELETQLRYCDDRAVAAERAAKTPVGAPRDFLNVLLEVDGATTLAGIRHYGGHPGRPFVDLVATTEVAAWSGARLLRIAEAALRAYPTFAPDTVRLARPGLDAPDLPSPLEGWRVEMDQALFAASLDAMLAHEPGVPLPHVTLKPAEVDAAMAFQAVAYDALASSSPALSSDVRPALRSALQACADEGHLVHWFLEDEAAPAGLLAVERTAYESLDGFLVVQECVAPWARGRRSATAAQRALARWLRDDDPTRGPLPMFGLILGSNRASRLTATRAGRRAIGASWFVRRA